MLKVNMNVTRSTLITSFILTTLIAILIANHRYDIGFREEQIYSSIIIVYFIGLFCVTPLLMIAVYCTTIDIERKNYIMNVLNIDDSLADEYITEIRFPTISDHRIKVLSGRNYILSDIELKNLNNDQNRFLFLLKIVKTSKKFNLVSSDYKDENIRNFIRENKKVYSFFK